MTAAGITAFVALAHGVRPEDITSPRRAAALVAARHEAWRIARAAGWTLEQIAREFDRHHTTILSGLRRSA